MQTEWDTIVVGGGAAGLSAALTLGRARRRTLLVDAGAPSNGVAHGIGGFLGQDGRSPAELYADGRRELAAYPSVEVRSGEIRDGRRADGAFVLELAGGAVETAATVLLATGAEYRAPQVAGVAERWGRSVFHCPFCHGWEVRGAPLGVLDRGDGAVHRALLLRAWSDDVTVLADGPAELRDEDTARLRGAGVTIDERPVTALRGPGDTLEAVVFADGSERPCGGLLVPVVLHQRSALAARLGAELDEPGGLAHDGIAVDGMGRTTVPGLFAAGDAAPRMPSVANAVAAGAAAAATIVGHLTGAIR